MLARGLSQLCKATQVPSYMASPTFPPAVVHLLGLTVGPFDITTERFMLLRARVTRSGHPGHLLP